MEFVFLNPAGTTLFVRSDLESGHWVEEQMNLTATFPFVADKLIQIGQRIAFRDPVTDILQVFEIVNVTNQEPEHFQQITAEHIVIAELSDEHINSQEITNKTASEALSTALTGTLWAVGTNTASGAQNGDFSRGSVWDAVNYIQQNWNVYITPRIVISSAGAITGRYLDIAPAEGTWRGLRLSIRKNMIDPSVTYDESEVYTALYGYGGNVEVPQQQGDDETEELTFADVVWSATSDHPAKPSGQTYLEWPEKTALYGRNGRPRFGYYQNSSITDAETLLEKTWESLKQSSSPKVSVSGTVFDLYRLGYKDQPIRLHDTAIIEIEETGEILQKQIICNDVDLLDPTGSRIEAGDYIPNIVYINRDTDKKASGGGGGGGRGKGSMTEYEGQSVRFKSDFIKTDTLIGMVVGIHDGTAYIKSGEITVAINDTTGETMAKIKADHVWMGTGEDSRPIDVVINGKLNVDDLAAKIADIYLLTTQNIFADGSITASVLAASGSLSVNQSYGITNSGVGYFSALNVTGGTSNATWQSATIHSLSVSDEHAYLYGDENLTPTGRAVGRVVLSHSTSTIHYLGY